MEIRERYLALYTGAIADILDKRGLREQVLPRGLGPRTAAKRVAGLAFTGRGAPTDRAGDDDTATRLRMLDSIRPGTVSVWACGGSVNCAHWGEMMSNAARQRGCEGAVIDGGGGGSRAVGVVCGALRIRGCRSRILTRNLANLAWRARFARMMGF